MEMLAGLFKAEKRLTQSAATDSKDRLLNTTPEIHRKPSYFERDRQALLIFSIGELLHQSQLTEHLAVSYIDRMIHQRYNKAGEELTAAASLLLASKFNEVDDNIPLLEELAKAHQNLSMVKWSQEEIRLREIEICHLFGWELDTIVPLQFVNNLVS